MCATLRTGLLIVAVGVCGVVAIGCGRDRGSLERARVALAHREVASFSSPPSSSPSSSGPSDQALPPPPSEVLAPPERREAQAVRRAVELAMLRSPGASVAFTDCAEDPCMTRLKSADPRVLHAVASDVSDAYQGHARIVLRRHGDGGLGRWFEADLTVGTPEVTPVPSLEAELPGAVASLPAASAASD